MNSRLRYYEDGYLRRWQLGPASATQRREAAAFLALGTSRRPCSVLDLGCGHGRYATGLATAGATVVGLDASRALLSRALAQGATSQSGVRFVRGDMRGLPFPRAFDVVLMVDAFGYFDSPDEADRVLGEIHRVLNDGGDLVARMPNGAVIRSGFEPSVSEERSGTRTLINRTLAAGGRVLREEFTIGDQTEVRHFAREQHIYSAAELDSLLARSGFTVECRYADLSGGAFEEATSGRMITVASRGR